ncbi:transmembrane protein 273-like isoform X1 [Carcharodon carcharias]|uniref:transmembrane protein 273-like isoform X1 n=1 Tax=Carcharodon carcharias TaxID=13397 RepID=UPI001B7E4079|nr:transmembrane protein 273-like isoform X1 [Carcharodon carcharias]
MKMVLSFNWLKVSLALILSLDYFTSRTSANGAAKNEDEIEIKYALLGAGIGIFLVISFVLVKIYMINKHIYENDLTDTPSRQSHSLREERNRIVQN